MEVSGHFPFWRHQLEKNDLLALCVSLEPGYEYVECSCVYSICRRADIPDSRESRAKRGRPSLGSNKGVTIGNVVNQLAALVGEPDVSLHEAKLFLCVGIGYYL